MQETAAASAKAPFKKPDLKKPLGKLAEEPVVEKQASPAKFDL